MDRKCNFFVIIAKFTKRKNILFSTFFTVTKTTYIGFYFMGAYKKYFGDISTGLTFRRDLTLIVEL